MTGRSPEARKRRAEKVARMIGNQRRAEKRALATVEDAAARQLVRLEDGRTARLLRVPAQSSHVSSGAKARVLLPSGAVLSVPMSELTVLYEPSAEVHNVVCCDPGVTSRTVQP